MTPFIMRSPCQVCRGQHGVEREKNGQYPVFCNGCGRYAGYCRPRDEAGRAPRSVSSSHSLKPKQKIRILERDGRCLTCGVTAIKAILHVSHLVGVKEALEVGETESTFNADYNLVTECESCNLGRGYRTVDLKTLLRLSAATVRSLRDLEALIALWSKVQQKYTEATE